MNWEPYPADLVSQGRQLGAEPGNHCGQSHDEVVVHRATEVAGLVLREQLRDRDDAFLFQVSGLGFCDFRSIVGELCVADNGRTVP